MPARDAKRLPRNFPGALFEVLVSLGISLEAVERELAELQEVVLATTNSRSHLGTLNDFSNMLWHSLQQHPDMPLLDAALFLARTPVQPLRPNHWPDKVTRLLLTPGSEGTRRAF